MTRVPFKTVDVYTAAPFEGNPVAVVLDANGLTTRTLRPVPNCLLPGIPRSVLRIHCWKPELKRRTAHCFSNAVHSRRHMA